MANSVLSEAKRKTIKNSTKAAKDLAAHYGVHISTIYKIKNSDTVIIKLVAKSAAKKTVAKKTSKVAAKVLAKTKDTAPRATSSRVSA